jgi:hypothetical protein
MRNRIWLRLQRRLARQIRQVGRHLLRSFFTRQEAPLENGEWSLKMGDY